MNKKPKNHGRAIDQTLVSFALSKSLLEEIDALAQEENRSRSNFIVTELQKVVARNKAQKKLMEPIDSGLTPRWVPEEETARAAEQPPRYGIHPEKKD